MRSLQTPGGGHIGDSCYRRKGEGPLLHATKGRGRDLYCMLQKERGGAFTARMIPIDRHVFILVLG